MEEKQPIHYRRQSSSEFSDNSIEQQTGENVISHENELVADPREMSEFVTNDPYMQEEADIQEQSEEPYEMPPNPIRPRIQSETVGMQSDKADGQFQFSPTGYSTQSSMTSIRKHCHESVHPTSIDKKARRQLVVASVLCLFFMIGEVVGGALAHSLAIMTDAAHLLTDFASFLISLLALYLGARPCTKKMSFGWYRAEVVGALTSVLLIWLVTGVLVYLAIMRIIDENYEIDSKIMLITSSIGVGVNIIMLFTLHDHSHGHSHESDHARGHGHSHGHNVNHALPPRPINVAPNVNQEAPAKFDNKMEKKYESYRADNISLPSSSDFSDETADDVEYGHEHVSERLRRESTTQNITVRAAWIHVLGDLVQSVGVMVAAMIIYFKPQLKIVDPVCTFLFSILVLFTTINILRDTLHVIMEATPRGLDFNEVKDALNDIPGVVEVHNLRMWSLTMNKTAVSAHLALNQNAITRGILRQAHHILRKRYLVHEVTIQLEQYVPEMSVCIRCQEPTK